MRWAALLALVPVVAGCLGSPGRARQEAVEIGRAAGLAPVLLRAGQLPVLGMEGAGPPGHRLSIYIEGDGRAWTNRWRASSDPTPTDPVGLRLAAADPARPLLYLARPCQYVFGPECRETLWTGDRLSGEVVHLFHQLIDDAKRRAGSDRVGLFGYSGGGALAALIAQDRRDVDWLVTVAANLDLAAWIAMHDVDPMPGSSDPSDAAAKLGGLAQTHFAGSRDSVVPPAIVQSFVSHLPPGTPARLVVVPGFDHACCWAADWSRLLQASAAAASTLTARAAVAK